MPINTKITKLRTARGWNKKQLADKLGLSAMVISKYEHTDTPMTPSPKTLTAIAKLFSISVYDLTGDGIAPSKPIHEGQALKQYLKAEGYNLKQLATSIGISRNELYYHFNKPMISQTWISKINETKAIKISRAKFLKAAIATQNKKK